MSEKKRFESGASKRKKQQEKMLKHEELLSKCPKLFDFGFKCNAAPAVEQQTKDASQPSDFDGNMKEAEVLKVEVVSCDTNVTRVDDDEQPELVHLKKEDLGSAFQDDIGLWSTSNITEEVRDFWCKQGHVECQHHDDDFSSSVKQYPDQKGKFSHSLIFRKHNWMAECVFCSKSLADGGPVVRLTSKGCDGIAKASAERDSDIQVEPGQQVHTDCRREFTNPICVQQTKRKRSQDASSSSGGGCILRSAETLFSYKEHCLFCGVGDRFHGKKKNHKLIPVRTMNFCTSIMKCCDQRSDEWCEKVKLRLTYVKDLPAADAVYHNICSTNFRNGKQIPQCFQNDNSSGSNPKKPKLGRPTDSEKRAAFLSVVEHLEANDEEQTTVNDLILRMAENLGQDNEPYSFKYMKQMLHEHFGENIVITDINGIENVVTFRRKAASILTKFFQQSRLLDCELEKLRVVETAASLIKSDIKSVLQSKDVYPSSHQMSNTADNLSYLPNTLQHFLDVLLVGKEKNVKVGSIGQALMQATRPRVLLTPLQLGLGVQMHHHFASRFLLDTLYQHGFCCSYSEVQRYERSAAISNGVDIPGFLPGHFMQYVADNVDHNIRTLDGSGTFHGMGILAAITPKIDHASVIKRVNVSAKDIAQVGRINIRPFTPEGDGICENMKTENSDDNAEDDTYNLT